MTEVVFRCLSGMSVERLSVDNLVPFAECETVRGRFSRGPSLFVHRLAAINAFICLRLQMCHVQRASHRVCWIWWKTNTRRAYFVDSSPLAASNKWRHDQYHCLPRHQCGVRGKIHSHTYFIPDTEWTHGECDKRVVNLRVFGRFEFRLVSRLLGGICLIVLAASTLAIRSYAFSISIRCGTILVLSVSAFTCARVSVSAHVCVRKTHGRSGLYVSERRENLFFAVAITLSFMRIYCVE